jgi:hypothetical protein
VIAATITPRQRQGRPSPGRVQVEGIALTLEEGSRRNVESQSKRLGLASIYCTAPPQDGADHRLTTKLFREVCLREVVLIHQEPQNLVRCRIRNRDIDVLVVFHQLPYQIEKVCKFMVFVAAHVENCGRGDVVRCVECFLHVQESFEVGLTRPQGSIETEPAHRQRSKTRNIKQLRQFNNRIATGESIITELWARAANALTRDELKWFAQSCDYTEMQARSLSSVIEGIGCLVVEDGLEWHGAGNFQSTHDVPDLLFSIAHQVNTLAGLMAVSSGAYARLMNPEFYARAKAAT